MKTFSPPNKVAFEKVIDLFVKRSENKYVLNSSYGKGYVQTFELEKGLQARFWDCCFNEGIQFFSDKHPEFANTHFTLIFFFRMQGLRFARKGIFLQESLIWDTLFISASTDYKINISPGERLQCLEISLSKKWISNNVFKDNDAFNNLKEKINITGQFSLLESMSIPEKKMMEEFLETSWKKFLGTFYIKSVVLRIVCDFFCKLKEKQGLNLMEASPGASIVEIEKYLLDHILSPMPNLKHLATKFLMSDSTLKRHFKKRYGLNMSNFFLNKKMEYAKQVMENENKDINEVAHMLGYKNASNFIVMFKKYMRPEPQASKSS